MARFCAAWLIALTLILGGAPTPKAQPVGQSYQAMLMADLCGGAAPGPSRNSAGCLACILHHGAPPVLGRALKAGPQPFAKNTDFPHSFTPWSSPADQAQLPPSRGPPVRA
jgi:hypothetical protein